MDIHYLNEVISSEVTMSVKLEILIYRYIQASLMRCIRKYNELLSKDVAKAVGISIHVFVIILDH